MPGAGTAAADHATAHGNMTSGDVAEIIRNATGMVERQAAINAQAIATISINSFTFPCGSTSPCSTAHTHSSMPGSSERERNHGTHCVRPLAVTGSITIKIKNDLRTQIVAELTALISTCTEISTPLHQHQSSWM